MTRPATTSSATAGTCSRPRARARSGQTTAITVTMNNVRKAIPDITSLPIDFGSGPPALLAGGAQLDVVRCRV